MTGNAFSPLRRGRMATLRAYSPAMRAERIAHLSRQGWLSDYSRAELNYLRHIVECAELDAPYADIKGADL